MKSNTAFDTLEKLNHKMCDHVSNLVLMDISALFPRIRLFNYYGEQTVVRADQRLEQMQNLIGEEVTLEYKPKTTQ